MGSDIRFFGTLALMITLVSVATNGAGMLLRTQSAWVQMPVTFSISILSFFVSMALTTVLLGAVDRISGGTRATASGAREDLKRAYLPVLGMTILQLILLIMGLVAFGIVIVPLRLFLSWTAGAWWLLVPVILAMVIALSYVSLRLTLASAAVVLGRLGPWTAIKTSWSRAHGHFLKILGVYLPMLPFMILLPVVSAMTSMRARSAMDPQDLSAAFASKPPPFVDALTLVSSPLFAVIGLWIGAAFALLWLHLDDSRSAPEFSAPVLDR
jgi:membrane-anchored glycerophosphoryl diester phosphodiesterase (GDPDase)